eukprot:Gb_27817 [translate_table: standard]
MPQMDTAPSERLNWIHSDSSRFLNLEALVRSENEGDINTSLPL